MQVDIGVLLEMDTLDRNMIPALHSDSDAMNAPSNSVTPLACSDMNTRAHLHPTTNIDHDRDFAGWDRTVYPDDMKHWPSAEAESVLYEYPCAKPTPAKYQFRPQVSSSQRYVGATEPSLDTIPHSFPVVSSNNPSYDTLQDLHINTNLSSPIQSREEAEWQMYLTASLSNPLDTLALDPRHDAPIPPFTSDDPDPGMMPNQSIPTADLFTLPDDSVYSNQTLNSSSHSHIPFAGSQLQPPADISPDATFNFNHFTTVNAYQEDASRSTTTTTNGVGNGGYTSFTGISSNPAYDPVQMHLSNLTSQAGLIIPAVPSPTLTPHPGGIPLLAHPSPVRVRRGLSGWGDTLSPDSVADLAHQMNAQNKRPRSISPTRSFRRQTTVAAGASATGSRQTSLARDIKRIRQPSTKAPMTVAPSDIPEFDLDSNDDFGEDDAESDDYRPSRSPSLVPEGVLQFQRESGTDAVTRNSKKKPRRSKGKARGSAALALAVVTQLGASRSQTGSQSQHFDDDFDPLAVYREGRHSIRKRKNHPIPLPVPIPNLNKKSRGRKVPFVTEVPASARSMSPAEASKGEPGSDENRDGLSRNSSRTRRKSSRMPTPVADELVGSRSYICVVPGCGKCFVRGEHLKRHVRSIHTHDKPHPCPFEGCDKSFSRRDNLGQHVRIHLQP